MNFGVWELVVILFIVAILFGTTKLGSIGADLGRAIRGFRKELREEDSAAQTEDRKIQAGGTASKDEAPPKDDKAS